jgi:hypothetical protein
MPADGLDDGRDHAGTLASVFLAAVFLALAAFFFAVIL